MILIDKPYISDFLIKTIIKNNYEVIATKEAKLLIKDKGVNWVSENEAKNSLQQEANPKIYTNSENSLSWIFNNLNKTKLPSQVKLFKDKIIFRELIKDIFPNFIFKKVTINEIQLLKSENLKFPFVIKPSLGFFSIGVHIINDLTDWEIAKKSLKPEKLKSIYPKNVLDTSTFIIEEYINGNEYAIDAYFNNLGEVVVLNILHHKFSSKSDVSDRVYSTSKSIIEKYKDRIETFLKILGEKVTLKNFPLHIEVRIDADGIVKPIEINPQRFGGWCTTGDLSWYAYGINSYQYFMENKKPNWNNIFRNKEDKIYSIILLNNNSGINTSKISHFDFNLIKNDLENVLVTREIDFIKYPAFGFLFIETSKNNLQELDKILESNLSKYIKLTQS